MIAVHPPGRIIQGNGGFRWAEVLAVIVGINMEGDLELPEVVHASGRLRTVPGTRQHRQ